MNILSWLSSMRSKELCTDWYEDADQTNQFRDLYMSDSCILVFNRNRSQSRFFCPFACEAASRTVSQAIRLIIMIWGCKSRCPQPQLARQPALPDINSLLTATHLISLARRFTFHKPKIIQQNTLSVQSLIIV